MGLSVLNVLGFLLLSLFVKQLQGGSDTTNGDRFGAVLHSLERAKNAPLAKSLKQHVEQEANFIQHKNPSDK